MRYRQWKKNYKKQHGENPPLELDKRKQARMAKKVLGQIKRVDIAEALRKITIAAAEVIKAWIEAAIDALKKVADAVGRWAEELKERGVADGQRRNTGDYTRNSYTNCRSIQADTAAGTV